MALRLITSAIGIPIVLAAIWFGSPWFSILVGVAVAVAALEISIMSRLWGEEVVALAIIFLSVVLIVMGHLISQSISYSILGPGVIAFFTLLSTLWLIWNRKRGAGLYQLVTPIALILYAGGFLFHAPLLRELDQGREWILFLILVTFATDTSAFFVGKALGRHSLAPTISPSKTWEGSIGGVLGALGASAGAFYAFELQTTLALVLFLGLLLGTVGQLGDLVESRLKRLARVKDSGWLIPGHGGILDRLDSIVFNVVVVYYFVSWQIQQKALPF